MKAIVYHAYGGPEVLRLEEVPQPTPKDNEVLVKVAATTVNYGDIAARNFRHLTSKTFNMPLPLLLMAKMGFGLSKPKKQILGNEFAGEVAAAGKSVTGFKPGDRVFGYLGEAMGGYAEYACVPESGIITKMPAGMTYEQAAGAPYGAIVAMEVLDRVEIRAGQKVLVNGASGAIGAAALQIAKSRGAVAAGTCRAARMGYVKALGADKVINYTK
jgi:NADPH:quinone reductase-like Zn-dependent oxidoreductase